MTLLALALWKRWRWSRRIAIVIAAIGIAMAVPALSSAVMDSRVFALGREGLQIMVRVMVIYYLNQEPVRTGSPAGELAQRGIRASPAVAMLHWVAAL